MSEETCTGWLEREDADAHSDVLRMDPDELLPLVIARCRRRQVKITLKAGREMDPCVCGATNARHQECYHWFKEHYKARRELPPTTEEFALPWRLAIIKKSRK